MQSPIVLRSPVKRLLSFTPPPILGRPSRVGAFAANWAAFALAWRERRRVAKAYRKDLHVLAGMSERDLADFGAPCWLRDDIARYR